VYGKNEKNVEKGRKLKILETPSKRYIKKRLKVSKKHHLKFKG